MRRVEEFQGTADAWRVIPVKRVEENATGISRNFFCGNVEFGSDACHVTEHVDLLPLLVTLLDLVLVVVPPLVVVVAQYQVEGDHFIIPQLH